MNRTPNVPYKWRNWCNVCIYLVDINNIHMKYCICYRVKQKQADDSRMIPSLVAVWRDACFLSVVNCRDWLDTLRCKWKWFCMLHSHEKVISSNTLPLRLLEYASLLLFLSVLWAGLTEQMTVTAIGDLLHKNCVDRGQNDAQSMVHRP